MTISSGQRPQDPLTMPVYKPAKTLSDTTRQLCGAAYLDGRFRDRVVAELLEDERRAVPPSFGFDLDPVVRHCLRARRLMLARDALVTGLVVLGLLVAPFPTVCWLTLGALLLFLRTPKGGVRQKSYLHGLLAVLALLPAFLLGAWGAAAIVETDPVYSGGPFETSSYESDFGTGDYLFLTFLLGLLIGLATFLVLLRFRGQVYEILVRELAYGQPVRRHGVPNARIERRLDRIAAGQRGNITVQESDPFLGAGEVAHGWSFAVTLRPAPQPSGLFAQRGRPAESSAPQGTDAEPSAPEATGTEATEPGGTVSLDPLDLLKHVRAAVLRMRDAALPERERVAGLYLAPHVVADGVRSQDDPLLDPRSQMPYTLASEEALEAIIRTPQGGLRYYERIVVPMGGKLIRVDGGAVVLPAQNLGCEVSVFVHFAVEGGRLYAELMATLLPPVRRRYQLVDALNEDRITGRSVRDTLRGFVMDAVAAPVRLLREARQTRDVVRRMDDASQDSQEFRIYDYGARLSVRQLAAEPEVHKFLQALDGWKYMKLLDRTVSEAVIDFLTELGVDTSEFRAGVMHVHNAFGKVDISGGQVNLGGANASFAQTNDGRPANG